MGERPATRPLGAKAGRYITPASCAQRWPDPIRRGYLPLPPIPPHPSLFEQLLIRVEGSRGDVECNAERCNDWNPQALPPDWLPTRTPVNNHPVVPMLARQSRIFVYLAQLRATTAEKQPQAGLGSFTPRQPPPAAKKSSITQGGQSKRGHVARKTRITFSQKSNTTAATTTNKHDRFAVSIQEDLHPYVLYEKLPKKSCARDPGPPPSAALPRPVCPRGRGGRLPGSFVCFSPFARPGAKRTAVVSPCSYLSRSRRGGLVG